MGDRRAIGLTVLKVYMDSSSLVYCLGFGPFCQSPAAPCGSCSPLVHLFEMLMPALTLAEGSKGNIYEAVCLEPTLSFLWPASGIKLIACIGLPRSGLFGLFPPFPSLYKPLSRAKMMTYTVFKHCMRTLGRRITDVFYFFSITWWFVFFRPCPHIHRYLFKLSFL